MAIVTGLAGEVDGKGYVIIHTFDHHTDERPRKRLHYIFDTLVDADWFKESMLGYIKSIKPEEAISIQTNGLTLAAHIAFLYERQGVRVDYSDPLACKVRDEIDV